LSPSGSRSISALEPGPGLEIVEQGNGTCRCTLKVEPHHFNTAGVVHGGVAYTLADTAMGAAIIPGLAAGERCLTIDITTTYFKAVKGGVLECVARIVNRGRSVVSTECSVLADGVVVARASGNYAIVQARGGNAA
jgi:acyl-CoA thioesterase